MLGGKEKRRTKGGGKGERKEKLVGKERKSGKKEMEQEEQILFCSY